MEHLDTLIEADKDASESFKRDFDGREIALEVIKGKSKNFNKLMNDKLQEIKTDLEKTLVALITSFAYRATLLALSVVPLKSMEKS
jgi:hypothetical protein